MNKAGVVLSGDWRKARVLMNQLGYTKSEVEKTILEEAYRIRDAVSESIHFGDDVVENAPSTERRKTYTIYNDPLRETGSFEESIIVSKKTQDGKDYLIVEANPNKRSPRTKVSYDVIALWMEYGVIGAGIADIPPRPTFTIVFNREIGEVARHIISKLREEYRRL